jgi:alkanesulfonate monooxygenase SsuD/methylene tetrahydromethanopterin reductase-like flavin-dependent oxidoreductase (luciferase family)
VVQYGFIVPGGDLETIVETGVAAEQAGWDGFFYYDHDVGADAVDPWIALAAVALRTTRVRLGLVLVPLPWRRPWLVARAATTLDHLSGGRVVLPIGLGAVEPPDRERGATQLGEVIDRRRRAEVMDEALDVIERYWRGEPFRHAGEHYRVDMGAVRPPLQRPRIPIWVVGAWGRPKSMRRALRYDGWLPAGLSDEDWPAVTAYLAEHAPKDRPFDVVWEGRTDGADPAASRATVQRLADVGVTWWMEAMWTAPNGPDDVGRRVRQGPPRA